VPCLRSFLRERACSATVARYITMSLDAPAAGGAGLRFTCQYLSLATNIFNPNQDSVRVLRRVQHMTKILVGLSLRRDTLGVNLHNVLFTGSFEEESFPRLGIEQTKKTRRRRERNSWTCLRAQGVYENCNKSYLLCKSGQCLPRAPAIPSLSAFNLFYRKYVSSTFQSTQPR
jgi:hypothetical protein